MKKIFLHLTILALHVSCGNSDNPEIAAMKFLSSFNERKFDVARENSTPETGKLIDLMENLTKLAGNSDSTVGGKIIIVDHHIDGEAAVVRFHEEGDESIQELHMVKRDGKWLAHVTKEDIANKDMPGGVGGEEGLMLEHDSLENSATDTMMTQSP